MDLSIKNRTAVKKRISGKKFKRSILFLFHILLTAFVLGNCSQQFPGDGDLILAPGWWDKSWNKRIKIMFSGNISTSNLVEFPVLITLNGSDLSYSDFNTDGSDIRFVDEDSMTVLSHEIEHWDPAGTSQIWVKVPVITGGSVSDSIWLYYKNQNASDGQNPAGVWSSGYAAVYHLNGNGKDARAVHNGTESTVADQDPGKIARARNFDGSISYIDIGSPSGVDDVFNGGGTLSAWIYPTGWGENNYGRILDKRIIETGGIGWSFLLNNNGPLACLSFSHGFDSGTNSKVWSSPASSITLNLWHHVAVVYDKTSAPILYINGIAQSLSATGSGTSADSDAAQNLVMGNHSRSPAGLGAFTTRTFDGHLDEVRISNVSRSADWMIAHNRTVNGMFHFFNAEENLQDILNRELPIFIYLNM